ncbi:CDP-diacylglycerol--glycerol-3-phosphate 3-phosphatidyltransferase [Mariluticola halotolerans]|uniref:CDP-diacylglycerol--glycerol-3-phosphate 3-phosphatidyltransferase n=1 Tax=Mariluticola halotolerans TaxID=2909283 RepID=UPI0026E47B90|nr:CDP-diacylglycerol--glycerol-3-phosphate 3-phosphatidyltransferase [Mariluticola halotolerans]UJQ94440.1 CDP-diacylglycerol--glycerol-3-phosphate 3-phosphatidyltransferase [Mariluticola halotolerans]
MTDQPQRLSLPNMLTVARIIAIPVIVVLAIMPGPGDMFRWLALLLYVIAAITDFFDGFLARVMGQTSALGRMLDPIADKLLVGALLITLAWDRTFSAFDLIPAIAIMLREIFVPGLREFLGAKSVVVHVSRLAKYKTTVQLVAMGILLAEPLMPGLRFISDLVLWLAAILTVWTGWSYWQGAQQHFREDDVKPEPDA